MQAPYQRDVGQFQMQQQARQQQAAIQAQQSEAQLRQAQTQQAQMETQLAPERLKLDTQLKLQQQQMMNMWYGGRLQQGGEKIDLTRANQQFTQDYKKQQLDLENRVQTGKLNVAQELASYNRMDDASKATYRVAMAQGIQGRLIVAQQALQAASTLKSAQAVKTATDAANQYNMFARIGRSLGLEDDLGMSLPEMQIPNVAVGAPTTVPITSPAAGRGAPSANPFRH
jgi:hypothetical protein